MYTFIFATTLSMVYKERATFWTSTVLSILTSSVHYSFLIFSEKFDSLFLIFGAIGVQYSTDSK